MFSTEMFRSLTKGGVCVFHIRETPTCMSHAWLVAFLKSPWDVTQGHFGFNNQVSDGGDTMNSFKSFVKTMADKAPEALKPPGAANIPAEQEGTSQEGFICPMCMRGFASPDQLQVHFEGDHGDGAAADVNVDDVRATLDREQALSADLKRQVERLTAQVEQQTQVRTF